MATKTDIDRKAGELVVHLNDFARRFMQREKVSGGRDLELSRREFRVIVTLGERPVWTMGEVARQMMVGMSGLTGAIDRLVGKGLADRVRSDEDRRTVRVRLTREGRRRYAQLERTRLSIARDMLAALSGREQDAFLGLMRKIGGAGREVIE
jgi:DNA-binding MarR family transcriptional regulator